MILAITITSILVLVGFVRLLNIILPVQICPICAGVSGTWIWMLTARFFGYPIDLLIPAILMGGSVVGIAYQVEKKMSGGFSRWRTPLLWKTLFISVGFILVYSTLSQWWDMVLISFAFLLLILFIFLSSKRRMGGNSKTIEELKKKMENCC